MIRISYGDTVLVWGQKDAEGDELSFGPREVCSWVTAVDQNGLKIEFLSGGERLGTPPP